VRSFIGQASPRDAGAGQRFCQERTWIGVTLHALLGALLQLGQRDAAADRHLAVEHLHFPSNTAGSGALQSIAIRPKLGSSGAAAMRSGASPALPLW
jgi:hypothetical protein